MKYSGLVESVEIRKKGWAYRYNFKEFAKRYNIPGIEKSDREICLDILKKTNPNADEYAVGNTKIFLSASQFNKLEKVRHAYQAKMRLAQLAQSLTRAYLARRQLALLVQKHRAQIEEERRRQAEVKH